MWPAQLAASVFAPASSRYAFQGRPVPDPRLDTENFLLISVSLPALIYFPARDVTVVAVAAPVT
jgi:hypothetical protein